MNSLRVIKYQYSLRSLAGSSRLGGLLSQFKNRQATQANTSIVIIFVRNTLYTRESF